MTPISATSMETRMLRTYWNDGLLDLMVGLGILCIGIAWRYDLVAMGPIAPALLASFWKPLREKWITPRIGYVEFSEARQEKTKGFFVSSILLGVGMLGLGISVYFYVTAHELPPVHFVAGLPAILLSLLAFLAAMGTQLIRFAIYGLILLSSGLGVVATDSRPEGAMLLSAAVMFVVGVVLLVRFFKKNPLSGVDPAGEG